MTHCWRHPKYYQELRKIRAASDKQQASGHKQQASSDKLRYTPTGILLGVDLGDKPQAKPEPSSGSQKPQATSSKHQASSHKR
tara:strand:+ start:80 stop:328 length:249 start_codon:yes stop_codon:yes gene_type:complete